MTVNPRKSSGRVPLTRDRVLERAVALADAGGVHSLSMRKLGQSLGVEAMSLYNHFPSKDAILDGIVDRVVGEVELAEPGGDWRASLRARCVAAYQVLLRHPWASALIESRVNPIPAQTRACEAVLGVLSGAGFGPRDAYRAFLTLDSYVYGFALQEVSWPGSRAELPETLERYQQLIPAAEYPHIAAIMEFLLEENAGAAPVEPGYGAEFTFGLDLVLDGLERVRKASLKRR